MLELFGWFVLADPCLVTGTGGLKTPLLMLSWKSGHAYKFFGLISIVKGYYCIFRLTSGKLTDSSLIHVS